MTNLEALQARLGYPLSENSFTLALESRGLVPINTFTGSDIQAFDLAYADMLTTLITSPDNVSEGGFSISSADRKMIAEIADRIYDQYDTANVIPKQNPTATFVQRW